MTREEAIEALTSKDVSIMLEALDMAINALEQLTSYEQTINKLTKAISEQEPKTGHWITWKEAGNEIASETKFECSVCHDSAQTLCNGLDLLSPYCPNCGARMKVGE